MNMRLATTLRWIPGRRLRCGGTKLDGLFPRHYTGLTLNNWFVGGIRKLLGFLPKGLELPQLLDQLVGHFVGQL